MTDQTSDVHLVRAHRPPKAEFMVYFAIIFIAALPLAFIASFLAMVRQGDLKTKGPIARAWSQARIITPMIFSA
ncbi:protein pufQ [Rhodovulum sp. BSW8]|uniref:Protein pufQ n=3 Tax=Rhodovulum TaxID=34008 RepID=A0A4R8FXN7_9RHOB|nr:MULTISPECIES: cytochrome PufQ [Rhodovulum]OLS42954.1 protein pufQ [Rhodovulum sulfidophilum]MBL3570629.1 protein pufQ [Rhodovulum visakhapatnamense]MBL3576977.1 protein pufQ [Rhodovulum visakhapatnamense]PTW44824.1 PufQ cytochrome subunit [Rhodovulum kholense]RAP40618.1 protein pufQ [Rhodovulum viride]